jgi:hypothetical protein
MKMFRVELTVMTAPLRPILARNFHPTGDHDAIRRARRLGLLVLFQILHLDIIHHPFLTPRKCQVRDRINTRRVPPIPTPGITGASATDTLEVGWFVCLR